MHLPRISIVIPTRAQSTYLTECLSHCLDLDYPDYEILVSPDLPIGIDLARVKEIPSGPVGPSAKRNLGMSQGTGQIVAFLDDDAFPPSDWLIQAVKYFHDEGVFGVGGPSLTPASDSFMQQASGLVLSSVLTTLNVRYRYTSVPAREVDELPSCNFLVRKSALEKVGGFRLEYWPGEDSVLCFLLRNYLGGKILYTPDVKVYHHRRALFRPHLQQISRYGRTRGLLLKVFPRMARNPMVFFHPLVFAALLIGLLLSILSSTLLELYTLVLLLYLLLISVTSSKSNSWRLNVVVILGVLATGLTYGLFFWLGLLSPQPRR